MQSRQQDEKRFATFYYKVLGFLYHIHVPWIFSFRVNVGIDCEKIQR